jgi:hypothetical protein
MADESIGEHVDHRRRGFPEICTSDNNENGTCNNGARSTDQLSPYTKYTPLHLWIIFCVSGVQGDRLQVESALEVDRRDDVSSVKR